MASPVAATVSPSGISAPNFATIFSYLVSQFQAIYGADAYLGNDSIDGQWIGVIASAISDCNSAAIAVYNSFSPTTAQGNGLSSNVKLNGLTRILGSYSTALLTLVGVAGTTITNGVAQDTSGNLWAIPSPTVIPSAGTITVTATCTTIGAISASASTINQIATPTLGWQSVNNTAAATPGNPVEMDAQLRVRQSNSVALPSNTIFVGVLAALQQVAGVTRLTGYENNTNVTNSNGIPANTLCFVVEGGAASAIAAAIAAKVIGVATFGNVATTVTDSAGTTRTINYQTPTESVIGSVLSIHALNGWATSTIALIQAAINAYLLSIPIGGTVNIAALTAAAMLASTPQAPTFLIKSVQINKNGGANQATDLALGFAEAASVTGNVNTVNLV